MQRGMGSVHVHGDRKSDNRGGTHTRCRGGDGLECGEWSVPRFQVTVSGTGYRAEPADNVPGGVSRAPTTAPWPPPVTLSHEPCEEP